MFLVLAVNNGLALNEYYETLCFLSCLNKYSPGPEYLDTPARNINMISIQAVNVLGSNNCRQCTEFGQPANAERRMPYAEGQTLYLDRTSTYARKHESTKARLRQ